MPNIRVELAARAIAARGALERFRGDGHERAGAYSIADLLVTASDCIREATARLYFDFAGNRTRELEYAVESLELCVRRLMRERAEFDAVFHGHPTASRQRGRRPPPDPSPFCFRVPPERIRVPAYGGSGHGQ